MRWYSAAQVKDMKKTVFRSTLNNRFALYHVIGFFQMNNLVRLKF